MQQVKKSRTCKVCGKPIRSRYCSKCWGTGEIGHLFWKRICPICDGSGKQYYCPDHPLTWAVGESSSFSFKPRCRLCGDTGWVYDSIVGRKPCPICGRKESSYQQSSSQQSPPESYGDIDGDGVPDAYDMNPFGPG